MLVGFIPVVSGQGTKIAQARLRLYQFCMSTLIQDLKTASCGLRFHAHFGKLSAAWRLSLWSPLRCPQHRCNRCRTSP